MACLAHRKFSPKLDAHLAIESFLSISDMFCLYGVTSVFGSLFALYIGVNYLPKKKQKKHGNIEFQGGAQLGRNGVREGGLYVGE